MMPMQPLRSSAPLSRSGSAWYAFITTGVHGNTDGQFTTTGDISKCEFFSFGDQHAHKALFEGYLFDRNDLASALNVAPDSHTDGQLAALAYLRLGVAALERLRGRYLIAILDGTTGQLVIGHDGMGLHPVYYAQCPGGIIFSSDIFALAYSNLIPREPNRVSLALSLAITHSPEAGATHFAHISRIPPGHYLQVSATGVKETHRFWQMMPDDDEPEIECDDYNEAFEAQFTRAVSRCMSRKPEGILLSGGLDSISVAALAAHQGKNANTHPLIACTGHNPPGYPPAESAIQARVAARLEMPEFITHAGYWLEGTDLLAATFAVSPHCPGPVDFWWAGASFGFHEAVVSRGVSRVLTGSGGDEWMGVHPAYAADLIKQLSPLKLYRLLKSQAVTGSHGWRNTIRGVLLNRGLKLLAKSVWARAIADKQHLQRRRCITGFPPRPWMYPAPEIHAAARAVFANDATPPLTVRGKVPSSFYRHALRHTWQNTRMFWELERQFHIGRLIGLEYQHPFHDQDLVAWCNRLPAAAFVQDGRNKSMLRPLVSKYLPNLSLEKQKKFSGERKDLIIDQVNAGFGEHWKSSDIQYLADTGIVDKKQLPQRKDAAATSFTDKIYLINLLSIERWCRTHLT